MQYLMKPVQRMTWEEFKEKHKEQLQDRMGDRVEKESKEYREMLDEERRTKVLPSALRHPPRSGF